MRRLFFLFVVCLMFVAKNVNANVLEANVKVDEIANNVSVAKDEAMRKAIRNGLKDVLLKVSTSESVTLVDELNDNQLQHFISSVQVWNEKSSDIRYIADVKLVINEDVLKSYMQENDLPLILSEERNVLIVPLLEMENGAHNLWGDDNFWRSAFLKRGKSIKKGNVNIYNIEKNLGNITAVETNNIYNMSDDAFYEISSFNRVESLYVVKYSLKDNKIYIKELPSAMVKEIDVSEFGIDKDVDSVVDELIVLNSGTSRISQNTEVDEQFDVLFTYNQLARWVNLKKILQDNSFVKDVKIKSMVNGKVYFSFDYKGVVEKLQTYLSLNGYVMKKEGGYYAIY